MIKSKRGEVKIKGNVAEIFADLELILREVRRVMEERGVEEVDKEIDETLENSRKDIEARLEEAAKEAKKRLIERGLTESDKEVIAELLELLKKNIEESE